MIKKKKRETAQEQKLEKVIRKAKKMMQLFKKNLKLQTNKLLNLLAEKVLKKFLKLIKNLLKELQF
jgi:hypothetical protein